LKDRRDRGLCFNCDEKFSQGHRCKKLFLIEGVYEEEDEHSSPTGVGEVEEEEEFEIPEISLHAISGVPTPQTMRISGTIQGARVILGARTIFSIPNWQKGWAWYRTEGRHLKWW